MKSKFKKILSKIENYLFPSHCLICHLPGSVLCPACRIKIKTPPPRCPLCGTKSKLGAICPNCYSPINNIYFDAVFALGSHEQLNLQLIIKTIENKRVGQLAYIMGRLLGRKLINEYSSYLSGHNDNEIIIMPMPLHKKQLRKEGGSQIKLIAQGVHEICNWPINLKLKRISNKKIDRQSFLRQNIFFNYHDKNNLKNKTIILVDSIFTTGATANTAACTLKKAGAKKVLVVVLLKNSIIISYLQNC